jgi:CHAD domain-containing protein
MAYKLMTDESVPDGIRRCAIEQLDRAIAELSERVATDPVDAVHAARKAVKKVRTLLRLSRGAMPGGQRRGENQALRDAARGLSAARDAEAMLDTLDALAQRDAGQLPQVTFRAIRERLECPRDDARRSLDVSTLADRAVGELEAVRIRIDGWKLRSGDWSALEPGLRRTYHDGRAAMRHADSARSGDGERWHVWRKRVKDLWYEQRLLAEVAGPVIAGQAKDAHRLADLLGDEHDLGVLRSALRHDRTLAVPVDIDAVLGLIDHRRAQLRAAALEVGNRVYAEKPSAYVRRMRRSWKVGRALARTTAARDPSSLAEATRAAPA